MFEINLPKKSFLDLKQKSKPYYRIQDFQFRLSANFHFKEKSFKKNLRQEVITGTD